MTLKTAVIGVGSMGFNHARVNWELPMADLVGIADTNQEIAHAVAKKFNTRAYSDYRKMLDAAKPDAVTLAVPTVYHHQIALEVIERGIPLLIEKPIAFTIEEGQSIIEAAKQKNVKLMIGHIERFNPAVIALKQHIANGDLGRVFQIDAHRQGPFPARINDVGVVIDLAVHDLDIMRYITKSDMVRVYAETERRIHSKHEDLLTGLVRMADGTVGTLTINWLTPTKIRELLVTGERGMFKVNLLMQDLTYFENSIANDLDWDKLSMLRGVREGKMTRYVIAKKEPLRAEQEAFLSAVRDDAEVAVSGEDGLRALEIAQAVITSGNENRVVIL